MDTSKLPEARLMLSDGRPLYLVFKTDKGWVGAPGLKRGQFLTDVDVMDGIPYVPVAWGEPAPTPSVEPRPAVDRVAVDVHYRRVMRHVEHEKGSCWITASGNSALGDDEVVELTGHANITLTAENAHEVAEFLEAIDWTVHDQAGEFIEVVYVVESGSGIAVELVIDPGTQIWRTSNVFYVRQPGFHYFQLLTRGKS